MPHRPRPLGHPRRAQEGNAHPHLSGEVSVVHNRTVPLIVDVGVGNNWDEAH